MRSFITHAIVAMLAVGTIAGAQAQSYVYNFNDGTATDTSPFLTVDKVNGVATPTGSPLSALSTNFVTVGTTAGVTSFAGTTVNADSGDTAVQAMALVGTGNNGNYIQTTANLTGFSKVFFSFATQKTGTGFNSNQFQYSLNGTDFTNFGGAYTPAAAFAPQSFDLSGVAGLAGDSNAAFRIVFNGATSTAGNNRIDNLIISAVAPAAAPAVPEASTTASLGLLLVLGLGGIVVARRRKQA